MRFFLATAALVFALPAAAESEFGFRGQWQITSGDRPHYIAVILIDGQRRATWDSPSDYGRPARFRGYVRVATDSRLEMVMTDSQAVVTLNCLIEASEMLRCHVAFADGSKSPLFVLTRVAGGPASLAPKR